MLPLVHIAFCEASTKRFLFFSSFINFKMRNDLPFPKDSARRGVVLERKRGRGWRKLYHECLPYIPQDQGIRLFSNSLFFLFHCVCEPNLQLLRDEFSYQPRLTKSQFLSRSGFAEHKSIFVSDVLRLCREHHAKLTKYVAVFGPVSPAHSLNHSSFL